MQLVDFGQAEEARGQINNWGREQTENRIEELLPRGALDGETALVLTNAAYFQAAWLHVPGGCHRLVQSLRHGLATVEHAGGALCMSNAWQLCLCLTRGEIGAILCLGVSNSSPGQSAGPHPILADPWSKEWGQPQYGEKCTLPRIVQEVAHVAFQVENLNEAIEGKEVIIQPNSPSEGVTVAFILENGAPVELLEFNDST